MVTKDSKKILELIRNISNSKIITIALSNYSQVFDIDKNGIVGYEKNMDVYLLHLIEQGLHDGGGIIIRQFTDMFENIIYNGKKVKIPYKNIYGISLGNNTYKLLSEKDVLEACQTCAKTGKFIPKEDYVYYKEFPVKNKTSLDIN